MGDNEERKVPCCSFCGKPQDKVEKLVAGPGVYICDECIELCIDILDEDDGDEDGQEVRHGRGEVQRVEPGELGQHVGGPVPESVRPDRHRARDAQRKLWSQPG